MRSWLGVVLIAAALGAGACSKGNEPSKEAGKMTSSGPPAKQLPPAVLFDTLPANALAVVHFPPPVAGSGGPDSQQGKYLEDILSSTEGGMDGVVKPLSDREGAFAISVSSPDALRNTRPNNWAREITQEAIVTYVTTARDLNMSQLDRGFEEAAPRFHLRRTEITLASGPATALLADRNAAMASDPDVPHPDFFFGTREGWFVITNQRGELDAVANRLATRENFLTSTLVKSGEGLIDPGAESRVYLDTKAGWDLIAEPVISELIRDPKMPQPVKDVIGPMFQRLNPFKAVFMQSFPVSTGKLMATSYSLNSAEASFVAPVLDVKPGAFSLATFTPPDAIGVWASRAGDFGPVLAQLDAMLSLAENDEVKNLVTDKDMKEALDSVRENRKMLEDFKTLTRLVGNEYGGMIIPASVAPDAVPHMLLYTDMSLADKDFTALTAFIQEGMNALTGQVTKSAGMSLLNVSKSAQDGEVIWDISNTFPLAGQNLLSIATSRDRMYLCTSKERLRDVLALARKGSDVFSATALRKELPDADAARLVGFGVVNTASFATALNNLANGLQGLATMGAAMAGGAPAGSSVTAALQDRTQMDAQLAEMRKYRSAVTTSVRDGDRIVTKVLVNKAEAK